MVLRVRRLRRLLRAGADVLRGTRAPAQHYAQGFRALGKGGPAGAGAAFLAHAGGDSPRATGTWGGRQGRADGLGLFAGRDRKVEIIWNELQGMNGPLQGLQVLDISNVIAGPFAAALLGDFGAEV